MRKYLYTICLLLLATLRLIAQDGFAPAFEIKADTVKYFYLPHENWQYFIEDKPVSFEQVLKPGYAKAFKPGGPIGKPVPKYWVRYRIKNTLDRPLDITLALYKESYLYILDNGKTHQYASGLLVPWSKRDGLKKLSQVEYTLAPKAEITVYEHAVEYNITDIYPTVGIWKNVVRARYIDEDKDLGELSDIFLGGFIFFAALFNLLFYFIVRERVYLFYAIMLLITSIGNCYDLMFYGLFKEMPAAHFLTMLIIFPLGQFFFFLVVALFLQADKYMPKMFRIFIVSAIVSSVSLFVNSIINFYGYFYSEYGTVSLIISTLPILLLIIITIALLIKKRRSSYLFAIAVLPFAVCMLVIYASGPQPDWFSTVNRLSAMWGVSVVSWSLFQRFRNIMNKSIQQSLENERLAREKEEERNALIAQQNELLEKQVAERTAELSQSLTELKQTQTQLIQSEKMASLGELTAGIAHEIQNPLNFVNNFSDVSVELLQELKDEAGKGDLDEVNAIADDVIQNLEKIAHHGRRADGIVKGMLQHSRASSGQKEPTDINALADEYLRLAYHGLRAKDKSFNAELITHFDESLPKVNAIPQDMGRVLLNLFTNAFYATQEKSKQSQSQFSGYRPTVTVTTKQTGTDIEITVKDNGTGIPDAIKDKILQPFFTTKPTGQGTGLGLSLSYDIVVKGHGGTIDINSKEGEGSEFIIRLPLKN